MLNNNFLMLLKLGKVCLNLDPLIKAVSPIAILVLTIILCYNLLDSKCHVWLVYNCFQAQF